MGSAHILTRVYVWVTLGYITVVCGLHVVWVDEWRMVRMVLEACAIDNFSKIQRIALAPRRSMLVFLNLAMAKVGQREGELQGATSGNTMSHKTVEAILAAADEI
jgi:hypothetical protein